MSHWRKRLSRQHQKVRNLVSEVFYILKRMDIALPVKRQLLKRHKYPDYGTWKSQYAPENGWEPCEWNYMRSVNVEKVISHLGVNQISASYVSKVARELDVKVTEFMERTINSNIPYLYVDASYFKVRDGVKYVNKALFVVVGVRTDGYREILETRVADAEHELT